MKKQSFTLLFLFAFTASLYAQKQPPYWNEIQAFKKADSAQTPPQNAILFVGSSSFRLWPDIDSYFPTHTIINRGFGGSSLPDVIRYEQETIFQYNPKQVVIYCGDNDLAASDTVTSATVVQRFQKLFGDIRKQLPNVPVLFVSIKPSPSRWRLKEKMTAANAEIKSFLARQKQAAFADVWTPMLDKDGKPYEVLFKEDKLHMKAGGYAIWARVMEPLLVR